MGWIFGAFMVPIVGCCFYGVCRDDGRDARSALLRALFWGAAFALLSGGGYLWLRSW